MVNKTELEKQLGYILSDEKYQEIVNLEYIPLTRIRNNLTFKHFSNLFVLGRAPSEHMSINNKTPITCWWCICNCEEHNILKIRVNNLTSGNTKSCGCHKKQKSIENLKKAVEKVKLDLTNQQFGYLIAKYPTDERKNNSVMWVCECTNCGNKNFKARTAELRRGKLYSCGCMKESYGVQKIKELLNQYNIPFIQEKSFENFKFQDTNGIPRFDFYIDNQYLIEYDGEQHFIERDKNFFKDFLSQRQEHDKIKTNYCKKHNIPLIRIPYTQKDKLTINDLLLNTSTFIV